MQNSTQYINVCCSHQWALNKWVSKNLFPSFPCSQFYFCQVILNAFSFLLWTELHALLPKFICCGLNPQCKYIWRQDFKAVRKIMKEVIRVGPYSDRLSGLIRRGRESSSSLPHAHTKERPCGALWEGSHLPARERALSRTRPRWHSDLGLPASRTVRKTFSYTGCGSLLWKLVMVWCLCSPPNSNVEILTPKDDGNGNWACGRYLNHRSGALMSEISEAYKRGSKEIPSLSTTWGPKTSTNQKSSAPTTLAPWSWDFYLQNCEK